MGNRRFVGEGINCVVSEVISERVEDELLACWSGTVVIKRRPLKEGVNLHLGEGSNN
jgi:hypothetical protein